MSNIKHIVLVAIFFLSSFTAFSSEKFCFFNKNVILVSQDNLVHFLFKNGINRTYRTSKEADLPPSAQQIEDRPPQYYETLRKKSKELFNSMGPEIQKQAEAYFG